MEERSSKDLGQVRREYELDQLSESKLPADPLLLFTTWMEEAGKSTNPDPTALTLTTVGSSGSPSSRIVLLKKIDKGKLVFFTNYHSRKAREIRMHPGVAAHLFWPELERQVKIAGTAAPLEEADSDLYFSSSAYIPILSSSSIMSALRCLFFKVASSLDAFSSYPVVRGCSACPVGQLID